jgi:hypothetical protein
MDDASWKALALATLGIGVGAMTGLAEPSAWYIPWLWALAIGLVVAGIAMWFWPSVRHIERWLRNQRLRVPWERREPPKIAPIIVPAKPATGPPTEQPRRLSAYEAERKIRLIDQVLEILRTEIVPAVEEAQRHASRFKDSYLYPDRWDQIDEGVRRTRDNLQKAYLKIESVKHGQHEHGEIAGLLAMPEGNSLASSLGHAWISFQHCRNWLKDNTPGDSFQHIFGPRELDLQVATERLVHWRVKVEGALVRLRRSLEPKPF